MHRRLEIAEAEMVLFLMFEDLKKDQIEHLEDLRGVRCEGHDSHSGCATNIHHINGELG
jgi:hypothetical protein